MKRKLLVIVLFLMFCIHSIYAELGIIVKPSPSWGSVSHTDVQILCENIVSHFEEHLRPENEINDKVNVSRTYIGHNFATLDPDPAVKYQIKIHLIRDMKIRADDFYYFALPFAHEFCHILHNFEITSVNNPNLWFQEGISTLGGVWALRAMAKTWRKDSPFGTHVEMDGGIAYFGKNFDHYADAYLKVFPEYQYEGTGAEWLEEFEKIARSESPHGSTKFSVNAAQLTFKFLPIFEANPEAWNAVRKMPATKGMMSDYMQDWHDAVDPQDKQYVEAIADVMGITLTSPVAYEGIDADVNNDGYVDLYDCLIVRSGIQNAVPYDTDVNNDGITNEIDLLIVKAKAVQAIVAASPRKRKVNITTWAGLKTIGR